MRKFRYYICDVFTSSRFGGNQLAVFPDADGLSGNEMQKIAREFNFSETTFVFPSKTGKSFEVRIFTPTIEVPFAGHPNIGTAFVLSAIGSLAEDKPIIFEEKAGLVQIWIDSQDQKSKTIKLRAPEPISTGKAIPARTVAGAVGLSEDDIRTENHTPVVASVGLPFVIAELRDQSCLEKAKPYLDGFNEIASYGVCPDLFVYTRSSGEFDIRARMFAPHDGVPEDPATGSANCALAGLLASIDETETSDYSFRVAQGFEMGRPSRLMVEAKKQNGKVVSTTLMGECVLVADGNLYLNDKGANSGNQQ